VVVLYRHIETTYQSHLQFKKSKNFLDFLTLEDGTNKLSRNIGTELPLSAV
jgi:hypothetical protein